MRIRKRGITRRVLPLAGLTVILSIIGLAGCSSRSNEPTPGTAPEATSDQTPPEDQVGVGEIVTTPVPQPTSKPDLLTQIVADVAGETEIVQFQLLGLQTVEWIDIGISLCIAVLGFTLFPGFVNLLIRRTLAQPVKQAPFCC